MGTPQKGCVTSEKIYSKFMDMGMCKKELHGDGQRVKTKVVVFFFRIKQIKKMHI